jgi:hypothetical protein
MLYGLLSQAPPKVLKAPSHGRSRAMEFAPGQHSSKHFAILAWLSGTETTSWSLTEKHLAAMGYPKLLPTPPFSIGRELSFDPLTYSGFVGYEQKELLLPVQKAIVRFVTQG